MVTAMKRRADAGPILATALLVCAAYYVGANVGFILRFPPATPSLLWPPNSILTATLLLSAPRRWGIYLLAALPAHLVAELGVFPVPLVLSLFVTNCSEALLAAICVRRFSDAPTHFDTLRRVVAFIVGAVFQSLDVFLQHLVIGRLQVGRGLGVTVFAYQATSEQISQLPIIVFAFFRFFTWRPSINVLLQFVRRQHPLGHKSSHLRTGQAASARPLSGPRRSVESGTTARRPE